MKTTILGLLLATSVILSAQTVPNNFAANGCGSATSCSVTLPSNPPAGSALSIKVHVSSSTKVTISDGQGDSFTCSTALTVGTHQLYLCQAFNVAGGATTIKAAYSGTIGFSHVFAAEIDGVAKLAQAPVGSANTTGVQQITSPAISLSQNSVLDAICFQPGVTVTPAQALTVGTGYTLEKNLGNVIAEYQVTSQSGSYTASCTSNTKGSMGVLVGAFIGSTPTPPSPIGVPGNFTLSIVPGTTPTPTPLAITSASPLPSAVQGATYSYQLTATGGTPPYTWAITSGALPSYLSLSSSGLITGTVPADASLTTYNFTATVTDSAK